MACINYMIGSYGGWNSEWDCDGINNIEQYTVIQGRNRKKVLGFSIFPLFSATFSILSLFFLPRFPDKSPNLSRWKVSGEGGDCPLPPPPTTVSNSDTGSLASLHTLFDTYLIHMLEKFDPNRMTRNVHNFEFYYKKQSFLKSILDKALTPLCNAFP